MQWFRWDNNARHNRKLRALSVEGRWLYLSLCELASQLDLKGVVHFVPGVKMTDEQLADEAKIPLKAVSSCLQQMAAIQLIEDREDCLFVIGFAERQFQSDSSASRTRAYRERKKQERDSDVTLQERHGDESVTPPHTQTHTQSHTQPPISPKGENVSVDYHAGFEEFWKVYPRTRKMNKGKALDRWTSRRKAGVPAETLLQAARSYAEDCRRERREEKHTLHPTTFLGPKGDWVTYADLRPDDSADAEPTITPMYGGSGLALIEQLKQLSPKGGSAGVQ